MRRFFIFILLVFLVLVGIVAYFSFFYSQKAIVQQNKIMDKTKKDVVCLQNDDEAHYEIKAKKRTLGDVEADIIIDVFDKETNLEKRNFEINNIRKNYHPIEIRRCGVYIMKMFNYQPGETKQEPGYKTELWKYNYNNDGNPIVLFHEKISENNTKIYKSYYSTDFRVDPYENYVVLGKWTFIEFDKGGHIDGKDISVAIKSLETKQDIFSLSIKDIAEQYPSITGNFNMREWTKDGRYFLGDIFDGANVLAFFRIEAGTWKWEIFEAPKGTMGGDALSPETGWVTYDDGAPWTGDVDFDQMHREKWQKEGKKVHFYIYNLFTKKQILLETIDDPTHSFAPHWLSNTELQYELTGGEKKVYKISKNN